MLIASVCCWRRRTAANTSKLGQVFYLGETFEAVILPALAARLLLGAFADAAEADAQAALLRTYVARLRRRRAELGNHDALEHIQPHRGESACNGAALWVHSRRNAYRKK